MKTWDEVIDSPEYQRMSFYDRERAKDQYFSSVVAPQLSDPSQVDEARRQFYAYDRGKKPASESAASSLLEIGWNSLKGSAKIDSRAAGVVVGTLNAPLAAVTGSIAAPYEGDVEEFNKMPIWQQALVSAGGGLESAWKSISEKGSFGTTYGDYYKKASGRTIEESLPDSLKWTAPTLEVLGNVLLDPVMLANIGQVAVKDIPKTVLDKLGSKLPADVVEAVQRMEKLEGEEKRQLQQSLLGLLKERKNYNQWLSEVVPTTKALPGPTRDFILREGPVLSEYSPKLAEELKNLQTKQLPAGQGFELVGKAYTNFVDGITQTNAKLDTFFGRSLTFGADKQKEFSLLQKQVSESAKRDLPTTLAVLSGRLDQLNTLEKLHNTSTKKLVVSIIDDGVKQHLDLSKALVNKAVKGGPAAEELFKAAELSKKRALTTATKFLSTRNAPVTRHVKNILGPEYVNQIPFSKKAFTAKASAGLAAGFSEDEEGNVTYDIRRGLAGTLLVAGVTSLPAKKIAEYLDKYPALAKVNNIIGSAKKADLTDFAGMFSKFNRALFDRFATLKKVSPEAHQEAQLFSSYKDVAALEFDKLKRGLSAVYDNDWLFSRYVTAHRVIDRVSRGIETGGLSAADAKQSISDLEAIYTSMGKNVDDLRGAMTNFKNWTQTAILDELYLNGILSEKAYLDITENNKWYAAFDVLKHIPDKLADLGAIPSGEFFSVTGQKVVKGLKGFGEGTLINDPIEATLRKFINARALVARNQVISTVVDSGLASGMFKRVAESEREFSIIQKQYGNAIMRDAWDLNEFETVARFKDGINETFLVPKDVAIALKNMTPWQVPRWLSAGKSLFTQAATSAWAPFTIYNAFRDAMFAYTKPPVWTAGNLPEFFKRWGKGLGEGLKHEFFKSSQVVEEYIKAGGGYGFAGEIRTPEIAAKQLFRPSLAKRGFELVTKPLDLITKVSAAVELAPRIAVFQKAQELGVTTRDAVIMGRRSTIDFNRGGWFLKAMGNMVPFLNANAQAKVSLYEAFKENPSKTLLKTFSTITLPAAGLYFWNRMYYSDLYDKIDKDIKREFFTAIIGTEEKDGKVKPKYITIPKGDFGQIGWNFMEFALDKLKDKDPDSFWKFAVNFMSDLSPVSFMRQGEFAPERGAGAMLPPGVKGVVEHYANKSFYTGKYLVSPYVKDKVPPELQYRESTPETYKWLGKKLGIAPVILQNYASNIVAGYGRTGMDPSSMLRSLTGRFVRTQASEPEMQANAQMRDIEEGYNYTRAYAKEFIKDGQISKANELMNMWNRGIAQKSEEFNRRFKKDGLGDKGEIVKKYRFTGRKRQELIAPKPTRR